MSKRKVYRFLPTTVLLMLIGATVFLAARIVERKDSREKNQQYFELADKTDVLLLGSSHMINGVNPAALFEDYGIASYNLGGHGNVMQVTYWELVNALDYGTPGYAVIDTYLLEKDYQYLDVMTEAAGEAEKSTAVDQLHEVMDAFPWTRNKEAALEDLLQDEDLRQEFRFDFIRYHSRWSSLTKEDYEGAFGKIDGDSVLGSVMQYAVDPSVKIYDRIQPDDCMTDDSVGKSYLRKILELCLEKEIYPVLVQIPYAENEDLQRIANSAQSIADEYGIPFLNMNYVEDIIDPRTDQQSQTHLNAREAAKTTAWLGRVLSEEVGVPDRRGTEGYDAWEQAVSSYHQQVLDNILHPKDLHAELMCLGFDQVSAIVFINNNSVAFYDTSLKQLIKNLSGTEGIETMAGAPYGYCLVYDPATGTNEETMERVSLENIETSFGVVNFTSLEDYDLLSVGDNLEENQLDYVNNASIDVQILIYDPSTGEKIGHLYFSDGGLLQMNG